MAAISSLAQNPDDKSMDQLIRLSKDADPQTVQAALGALGQIGSERAQQTLLDASRSGKPEERAAAITGLAGLDDPRASQQLASLMRDPDPTVAMTAISSSYNGGPEVDSTLTSIVNDPNTTESTRMQAAMQLRNRGTELDAGTEAAVNKMYGGNSYGGYAGMRGGEYMVDD